MPAEADRGTQDVDLPVHERHTVALGVMAVIDIEALTEGHEGLQLCFIEIDFWVLQEGQGPLDGLLDLEASRETATEDPVAVGVVSLYGCGGGVHIHFL